MPTAWSYPAGTMPKHTYEPAARFLWLHRTKASKPSMVVGGGEMKRLTSSVDSRARSHGASESCSSRSRVVRFISSGTKACHSGDAGCSAGITIPGSCVVTTLKGIISIGVSFDALEGFRDDGSQFRVARIRVGVARHHRCVAVIEEVL